MSVTLVLPRELTIYTVGELRPAWLDWLHTPGNDTVDGAAVDEADAAGLQMLLALRHALQAAERSLTLQQPSAALVAACTGLGMESLLGAPT
jgi:anti-anti-sigma regulatory factor